MTRVNRPWFPFHTSQIASATRHLTDAQFGAFVRLLMHQWERGSIPNDPCMMARIAVAHPPTWKRTWVTLAPLFTLAEGGLAYTFDPLVNEYTKSVEISNKRKEAGGANARANAHTRARGLNTSQSEVSKKEPSPTPSNDPPQEESKVIRLPPSASPSAGEREGPASEFDWESSDGRIFVAASQIKIWAEKFPLLDIRAQLRHAKRDWLSSELSQVAFVRRFVKGLQTAQEKAQKRQTKKAIEAGTQKTEHELMREHQRRIDEKNAKADAVRERLGYG